MFIVPAHKENILVSRGRGKGGLATIWDKRLTKYVSKIASTNFRLQATKFNFPSGQFLLINTYFPCDPQKQNFDDTELLTLQADIESVIRTADCPNVTLAGDLNAHFLRDSTFTRQIKNFLADMNLKIFWENTDNSEDHLIENVDFTHLFIQDNKAPSYSTIDHFAANSSVFNAVTEAGVVHCGANPSNHSVIYAKFKVGSLNLITEQFKSEPKVNWTAANHESREEYKKVLTDKLNNIPVQSCVDCRDLHCEEHLDELENYTLNVLEAVEDAGKQCLPLTGGGNSARSKVTPGWSQYVGPFKKDSKFWYSIWLSAGRPISGVLFDIMRKTKLQYKYAVRRLKRVNNRMEQNLRYLLLN